MLVPRRLLLSPLMGLQFMVDRHVRHVFSTICHSLSHANRASLFALLCHEASRALPITIGQFRMLLHYRRNLKSRGSTTNTYLTYLQVSLDKPCFTSHSPPHLQPQRTLTSPRSPRWHPHHLQAATTTTDFSIHAMLRLACRRSSGMRRTT